MGTYVIQQDAGTYTIDAAFVNSAGISFMIYVYLSNVAELVFNPDILSVMDMNDLSSDNLSGITISGNQYSMTLYLYTSYAVSGYYFSCAIVGEPIT